MTANQLADDAEQRDDQQRITEAVQGIVDQRAPIEQAKGMLMFVYGVDAAAAYGMLRSQSQDHNVKLRLIADQIVKDLIELSRTNAPAHRIAYGGLLARAHQRISNSAARQRNGESKTGVAVRDLGTVAPHLR